MEMTTKVMGEKEIQMMVVEELGELDIIMKNKIEEGRIKMDVHQNQGESLIFILDDDYEGVEEVLWKIYNTLFMSGEICRYRSDLWRKKEKQFNGIAKKIAKDKFGEEVEIDYLTMASILYIRFRNIKNTELRVMSYLTYWLSI